MKFSVPNIMPAKLPPLPKAKTVSFAKKPKKEIEAHMQIIPSSLPHDVVILSFLIFSIFMLINFLINMESLF